MHMLSNKSQTFQGLKGIGASWPVTTPCTGVKLNSKVVKLNSDRKVQSTGSFLTLRSSLGYMYCIEVLEDCIFLASWSDSIQSYAKEPLLSFLKAILVHYYGRRGKLSTYPTVFSVMIELMLSNCHWPDTFCQLLCGPEPCMNIHVSRSKCTPTYRYPETEWKVINFQLQF